MANLKCQNYYGVAYVNLQMVQHTQSIFHMAYTYTCRSGHSSIIDEIKEQLHGNVPDAIVVAVGGGGLLCGICQGLHQVGWGNVPVVAMETVGCDSLNYCIREKQWTQLSDITRLPRVCVCVVCVCVCVCACACACACACVCVG